jgi:hypothetical protein
LQLVALLADGAGDIGSSLHGVPGERNVRGSIVFVRNSQSGREGVSRAAVRSQML